MAIELYRRKQQEIDDAARTALTNRVATNNTNWQSYTPTFVGFGTVTNISISWRRVGDSIEIQGAFETGTPNASTATFTLPPGLLKDTTKMLSGTNAGTYFRNQTTPSSGGALLAAGGANNEIFFGPSGTFNNPNVNGGANDIGSNVAGASEQILINITSIPIQGWDVTDEA